MYFYIKSHFHQEIKKPQTRILQKNNQARQKQESKGAQKRALLAEQSCCIC